MRSTALLALLTLLLLGCPDIEPRFDLDGDGVEDQLDCAPSDPLTYPGADDPYGDGVDTDCSGTDGLDFDGDGYPANPEEEGHASLFPACGEWPGSVQRCVLERVRHLVVVLERERLPPSGVPLAEQPRPDGVVGGVEHAQRGQADPVDDRVRHIPGGPVGDRPAEGQARGVGQVGVRSSGSQGDDVVEEPAESSARQLQASLAQGGCGEVDVGGDPVSAGRPGRAEAPGGGRDRLPKPLGPVGGELGSEDERASVAGAEVGRDLDHPRDAVAVGDGEADQVIEVERRRVVVAEGHPEGLRQPLQQEAPGLPVGADQEDRGGGGERRDQHGLPRFPADDSQAAQQSLRWLNDGEPQAVNRRVAMPPAARDMGGFHAG